MISIIPSNAIDAISSRDGAVIVLQCGSLLFTTQLAIVARRSALAVARTPSQQSKLILGQKRPLLVLRLVFQPLNRRVSPAYIATKDITTDLPILVYGADLLAYNDPWSVQVITHRK